MHEVPLIRFDPDGKIRRMLFFVLVFEIATFVEQVVHDLAGQLAIDLMGLYQFLGIEVDGAIAFVGITVGEDGFDHLDLLDDMTGSAGLYIGR